MSDFLLTKLILDVDGIKRTAKDSGRTAREELKGDWLKRSPRRSKDFGLLNSNPLLFGFVVRWPEAGGEMIN